jgi:hypothetical protein
MGAVLPSEFYANGVLAHPFNYKATADRGSRR